MKQLAAVFAFILLLSAQAMAQGKGGGVKGGGKGGFEAGDFGERGVRVHWAPSIESAVGPSSEEPMRGKFAKIFGEPVEKKFLLVYVRPLTEVNEPGEFSNDDVVKASYREWSFVKMDPDKDNPYLKSWGVRTAGVVVGCDLHANSFMGPVTSSADQLRRILGGLPGAVASYEQKLRAEYGKAVEAVKADEARGTKLLIELAANGKPGYKEVAQAQARLGEQAESAFRRGELAESVGPEAGIEYYEEVSKTYKGTPPGARADLKLAKLERERGNAKGAQAKLQAVSKLDPRAFKAEVEEAQKLLEER
jgi:hypothetical protein